MPGQGRRRAARPPGQRGHLNGPGRIRGGQGRCRAPVITRPAITVMAVVLDTAARPTGQRGCRRSPARRRRDQMARRRRARIARRRRAWTARRRRIAPEGFPAREQLGGLELEVLHRHSVSGHGVLLRGMICAGQVVQGLPVRSRPHGGIRDCPATRWRRATDLLYAELRTFYAVTTEQ